MNDWLVTHDFAFSLGGAERVTAVLAEKVLDGAPVHCFGGDPEVLTGLGVKEVHIRHPRLFRPASYRQASLLLPASTHFRSPIEGNVLASSYAFAHHVAASGALVVYCHTPLRQAWSGRQMYLESLPKAARTLAGRLLNGLRHTDRRRALAADAYIANSRAVAERIAHFYGIEPVATVHPPYDPRFRVRAAERGDHYVWAGRIVEPYKRLEPLIEAFRGSDRRLLVIGDGRDGPRLRATAPPNVTFVGSLGTEELAHAYSEARAVLFPSEDDFGIVPIEAMACGAPVIALGRGGALDTVVAGETGVYFPEPTPSAIATAIDHFERERFDTDRILERAHDFSEERFVETMRDIVTTYD